MELIIFTILGFGFLLGLKHALEADHVVAVSTIISETKDFNKSLILGASWEWDIRPHYLLWGY
jgi:high-affinity nickel permease